MKLLTGIFLLLLVFMFPYSSNAQRAETNLDSCNSIEFCDNDKTTWVQKSSCRLASQYDTGSERSKEIKFNSGGKYCICHYERLPNSCGNRGGIKDAGSNYDSVFGRINPPPQIGSVGTGEGAITNIIQKGIQLIYVAAGIGFVIMFLYSAFQMIISGGDKEAIAGARKRITYAIIGLALLAFAFPIMAFVGYVLGFKLFS